MAAGSYFTNSYVVEIPARLCIDVHLAPQAIANGWLLWSFDTDFEAIASVRGLRLDQLDRPV